MKKQIAGSQLFNFWEGHTVMLKLVRIFISAGLFGTLVACVHAKNEVKQEPKAVSHAAKKVRVAPVVPDIMEGKTEQLAKEEGNSVVSSIKFEKNRHGLDEAARSEVDRAIQAAKDSGKIDKVTVAVWSDREYPGPTKKLNGKQMTLARERGLEIQKYLKENMKLGRVDIVNMAKAPSDLSKYLKSSEARLKDRLVSAGVAPTTDDEPVVKGRASTALILVKTK